MNDLQKMISLFVAGFVAGAGEFGIGLSFFLGDTIKNALLQIPISQSSSSATAFSTYDTGITILMVGLIIANFLVGLFLAYEFSTGFLLGDLFMIVILYNPLKDIAPSVNTHMIIAFIAVLIGIVMKMYLDNQRTKREMSQRYYY